MRATDIPGKTTEGELDFLQACASLAPRDGTFVELGCYQGRSTAAILDGTICDVVSVDNFTYSPPGLGPSAPSLVAEHLGLQAARWRCVLGDSAIVPKGITSVAFLFVDTEHTAARLTAELAAWLPLMGKGAWVVLHDYSAQFPGIVTVADRVLGSDPAWLMAGREGVMAAWRKVRA